MQVKAFFDKYWPVGAAVAPLILSLTVYFVGMNYQIQEASSALVQEHQVMKAYVDAKVQSEVIRINDLSKDVEKLHTDLMLSNERIDNTLSQIIGMQKDSSERIQQMDNEHNQRLDQLMIILEDKRLRK